MDAHLPIPVERFGPLLGTFRQLLLMYGYEQLASATCIFTPRPAPPRSAKLSCCTGCMWCYSAKLTAVSHRGQTPCTMRTQTVCSRLQGVQAVRRSAPCVVVHARPITAGAGPACGKVTSHPAALGTGHGHAWHHTQLGEITAVAYGHVFFVVQAAWGRDGGNWPILEVTHRTVPAAAWWQWGKRGRTEKRAAHGQGS